MDKAQTEKLLIGWRCECGYKNVLPNLSCIKCSTSIPTGEYQKVRKQRVKTSGRALTPHFASRREGS